MKNSIIGIVAVGVIGGGSFYAGMKYDQTKMASNRQARFGQFTIGGNGNFPSGGQRAARAGGMGNFTAGEVIAKDDKSVTIKLPDGGSRIIFLSGSVAIAKSIMGSANDIAVGAQVTAMGTANSDGSIAATSLQIRPQPTSASVPQN